MLIIFKLNEKILCLKIDIFRSFPFRYLRYFLFPPAFFPQNKKEYGTLWQLQLKTKAAYPTRLEWAPWSAPIRIKDIFGYKMLFINIFIAILLFFTILGKIIFFIVHKITELRVCIKFKLLFSLPKKI
jgi:hypothetical protein